jgi:hypothetical protein
VLEKTPSPQPSPIKGEGADSSSELMWFEILNILNSLKILKRTTSPLPLWDDCMDAGVRVMQEQLPRVGRGEGSF